MVEESERSVGPGGPKITFGIIVLNGEPFTRYNLRALYPFAHEIIVVEGASKNASASATPDGHSIDGTLDVLRDFKEREDPQDKVQIVTRDGFWDEKTEQSSAYSERATGEYLWQIDIDEFYMPGDMESILEMLRSDPAITQVNYWWHTFWGGFDFLVDGMALRHHLNSRDGVRRLFKWGPGYEYVEHRPPTVVDERGRDMADGALIGGRQLARAGVYCYHYSMSFPKQVERKMAYYARQSWKGHENVEEWADTTFKLIDDPFNVHHISEGLSWIEPFEGRHPPQIESLISDLESGVIDITVRPIGDLQALVASRRYKAGATLVAFLTPFMLRLRNRAPVLEATLERAIRAVFSPPMRGPGAVGN